MLIDGGASVDSANNDQVTPLHISTQNRRKDFVELLLDQGADVGLQNAEGKSALELCNDPYTLRIILAKMRTMKSTDISASVSTSRTKTAYDPIHVDQIHADPIQADPTIRTTIGSCLLLPSFPFGSSSIDSLTSRLCSNICFLV